MTLDASASSSGNDISYKWTTNDGNIIGNINNAITEVDEPGMYYFELTQSVGGVNCTVIDSIEVLQNISMSTAEAGVEDTIDCQTTTLMLDGTGTSTGSEFSYLWTTTNGGNIQDSNTLTPTINQAGTYYLEVTNSASNCTTIDSVLIVSNNTLPTVDAGSIMVIDCANATVQLDGSASSQGTEFEYLWTTFLGTIDSGEDGLSPIVSDAGIYELLVTNITSSCTATATVEVTLDTLHPVADAGTDIVLNCDLPNTVLDGNGSSTGSQYVYQWTVISGGPLAGDANSISPQVDAAGVYKLVVENSQNSCMAVSQVTVTEDFTNPIAEGGDAQTITCDNSVVTLDGSGSSTGTEFSYQWDCLLYTSPSPRDQRGYRMPSSA